MNAKYASKPNFNPNKANLFGFANVILADAGIQILLLEAGSWLLEAVSQKQSQFFYDQICIINIKIEEMEAKKLGKKTKQTQLWITFNIRCRLYHRLRNLRSPLYFCF
jgi:hypothetical protein